MKTSVIEVHDMLSVWSVDEVEKRIGQVRGVESVTVNYAAKSATVRYDETRLQGADIKSAVRRSGYKSADESLPKQVSEPKPANNQTGPPSPKAEPPSASTPETAGLKEATVASVAAPAAAPAPKPAAATAPATTTTAGAARPKGEAWHSQSAEEVLAQLSSAATGLSAQEAAKRLAANGPNE
jgi:Cu2+-exporting ATPase